MDLFITITALLGAYSTYFLAHHNRFDGIRASAATSIIAFAILSLFPVDVELYSVAFFWGDFHWHERTKTLWHFYISHCFNIVCFVV